MSTEKKKKVSILYIGHIAIDNVIKNKVERKPTLGGSVCFSSLALQKYTPHADIGIVSKIGTQNFPSALLEKLNGGRINMEGVNRIEKNNTNFVLDYSNHYRKLTLKSRSPDIQFEDIPSQYLENKPDAIILVPICNEISYNFAQKIAESFPDSYVGIDLQGFIRNIDKDGKVSLERDQKKVKSVLKIINLFKNRLICKGSDLEMQYVSGKTEFDDVMDFFNDFKGIFIMTLGEGGSIITQKNHGTLKIPAYKPQKIIDETGAGDVYLSVFMYEYLKSPKDWTSLGEIGRLAAAAASFLIERKGVAGFQSKKQVKKRVKKKNYIS
mgnify:CR=1 FL=1